MTTTTAPIASPTTTAAAQEQISPGFFRLAWALLLVGTVLSLGTFAAVAYKGSIASSPTSVTTAP